MNYVIAAVLLVSASLSIMQVHSKSVADDQRMSHEHWCDLLCRQVLLLLLQHCFLVNKKHLYY